MQASVAIRTTGSHVRAKVGISSSGTGIAVHAAVRKLEARYHPPLAVSESYVVVAHITWEADLRPRVEPAPSLASYGAPVTILATLRHLVLMTGPRSFERLQSLRSRYWSFVVVAAG